MRGLSEEKLELNKQVEPNVNSPKKQSRTLLI